MAQVATAMMFLAAGLTLTGPVFLLELNWETRNASKGIPKDSNAPKYNPVHE